MKLSQKAIRAYKEVGAEDITYASFERMNNIMHEEGSLDIIHWSAGINGRTGAVCKGFNSGKLYVIGSRTSALAMV